MTLGVMNLEREGRVEGITPVSCLGNQIVQCYSPKYELGLGYVIFQSWEEIPNQLFSHLLFLFFDPELMSFDRKIHEQRKKPQK